MELDEDNDKNYDYYFEDIKVDKLLAIVIKHYLISYDINTAYSYIFQFIKNDYYLN